MTILSFFVSTTFFSLQPEKKPAFKISDRISKAHEKYPFIELKIVMGVEITEVESKGPEG